MTPLNNHCWACCVHDGTHFTYVYGPHAQFWRLSALHGYTVIQKGLTPSLAQCRHNAETAAIALQDLYQGIGTALAMPVEDFLAQLSRPRSHHPPQHYRRVVI